MNHMPNELERLEILRDEIDSLEARMNWALHDACKAGIGPVKIAKASGVSRSTIFRRQREGTLPYPRKGLPPIRN